jgi:hypothetical protein
MMSFSDLVALVCGNHGGKEVTNLSDYVSIFSNLT